ncbi:hypothetical protein SALBM217S_09879 [Streptomyces griseoloalbus]
MTLSKKEAGKGGDITVKGTGWRSEALLDAADSAAGPPRSGA